ncbi:MAG: aminopeptidase P family protein [Prolixibacteraceae bacterium]|nr:aminopeptidase P family protein [Prolixibacteraceae bacterium]
MNKVIKERLQQLRSLMKEKGLAAWLINGADPHMSEDVPNRWLTRKFISNFSGSYGWLAITLDEAVLWTDSRYFLQCDIELKGTGIEMLKARMPDTIPVEKWVADRLKYGDIVGFDGSCYPAGEVLQFEKTFSKNGIEMIVDADLLDEIWNDRPGFPTGPAKFHPLEWAGKSRREKIELISDEIEKQGAEFSVVSALDDLCWTFNIRGNDIPYNPVVMSFALVGANNAKLFIDKNKFSEHQIVELQNDGVEVFPYNTFYTHLKTIAGKKILIDPNRANYLIYKNLAKNTLIHGLSIPALMKSRKNESEIAGMKKAHLLDGLALLDFQLWLEETLGKESVTEYDVAVKLAEYRSKREGFKGESFPPIVGYKEHGAIVHYRVSPDTALQLKKEGILLFDSGGQYTCGTTDITRTIALGAVSDKMKHDFTLALKGMIALSKIKFPRGTIGCHLDVLARKFMWEKGIAYGHGTCHGVGAYLNVHEGPISIRPDLNNQPICPGNIISNEPGIYRTGEYGVRTENVMLCVEDVQNEFGDFLAFETITRFPIDRKLIDRKMLDADEVEWINNFHRSVLNDLMPIASPKQLTRLKELTQPL